MAKIISYPTAQPKADDFVLGAQVSDPGEPIESPTKKFSISSIINLAPPNQVGSFDRLQKILTSNMILSANTTPVEILPAPGQDKSYNIAQIALFMEPGNTPYDAGASFSDFYLEYQSPPLSTLYRQVVTNNIFETTTGQGGLVGKLQASSFDLPNNLPYIFRNRGNAPTQGDGTLYISIAYKIIDLNNTILAF